MSEPKVGDRVSWIGSIDFGRRTVRWHGHVTKLGMGVPFYHDPPQFNEDGFPREAGLYQAVEVTPDYPQHGRSGRRIHELPIIVPVKDLTIEPDGET